MAGWALGACPHFAVLWWVSCRRANPITVSAVTMPASLGKVRGEHHGLGWPGPISGSGLHLTDLQVPLQPGLIEPMPLQRRPYLCTGRSATKSRRRLTTEWMTSSGSRSCGLILLWLNLSKASGLRLALILSVCGKMWMFSWIGSSNAEPSGLKKTWMQPIVGPG